MTTDVTKNTSYTLGAGEENLTLTGTANIIGKGNELANTITANSGNDTLDGGSAGADKLIGGSGIDTYIVNHDGVSVTDTSGKGIVITSVDLDYGVVKGYQTLDLIGSNSIRGIGSGINNTTVDASKSSGDDTLDANFAASKGYNATLIGGSGNDTFVVEGGNNITIKAGTGKSTVEAWYGDYTLQTGLNNLTMKSDGYAKGNSAVNTIKASNGNCTLDGGGGNDILIGGAGDDTFIINNTGVTITEGLNSNGKTDTVQSSITYTLASTASSETGVDNLNLVGAASITGTGNEKSNVIDASATTGAVTLTGGGAKYGITEENILGSVTHYGDTLIGGSGVATYVVTELDYVDDLGRSHATVINDSKGGKGIVQTSLDNYTLNSSVENLVLTGTANLTATGNNSDDTITSNSGIDTLIGGSGSNTYIVNNAKDVIKDKGKGTVKTSLNNYTLAAEVENLTLTGTGNLIATGNSLDNVLRANDGNTTLIAGDGKDTLYAGAGTDVLISGKGVNELHGGAGVDTYVINNAKDAIFDDNGKGKVQTSLDGYTLTSGVHNLTLTGAVALTATGNDSCTLYANNAGDTLISGSLIYGDGSNGTNSNNPGYNTLIGGAGNDTLYAGAGNDSLFGGIGNNVLFGSAEGTAILQGGTGSDTFVLKNIGDRVIAGKGISTIQTDLDRYSLGTGFNNLTLTGTEALTGTGNALANVLTDNGAVDTLIGGAGNDTYVISNAKDLITEGVTEGIDTIKSSVSYTLGDNLENLTLTGTSPINGTGNSLANVITDNNGGGDTLDGGSAGADTLIGSSAGKDTFVISHSGETITAFGTGNKVNSSISYTLGANLGDLVLTGSTALTGTGNALANTITSNGANDTLDGGAAGADILIGGEGADTFVVSHSGMAVQAKSHTGKNTVAAGVSYTLGENLDNLTLTGKAVIGTGNALDNVITDNGGLVTLVGGAGDDTYVVSNSKDVITEFADGGTELVKASASYTLAQNLENLTLTGTGAIVGTGNALANTITSNGASDILDGGAAGADTLIGGTGADTFIVSHSGVTVQAKTHTGKNTVMSSIDYTLGENLDNLTLAGTKSLTGTGNSLANVIKANNAGDTLISGSGASTLIGGTGNDVLFGSSGGTATMNGGGGSDTYILKNLNDKIVAGKGISTVQTSLDGYTLGTGLNNLTLTGSEVLTGTGNILANVLTDNGAADTLVGGAGNDTYVVSNAQDLITEITTGGADTVKSSVSFTLGDNLENLTLTGTSQLTGTGNALANIITDSSAAGGMTLDGGSAGADKLIGSLGGNDTFIIGHSGETIVASGTGNIVNSSLSYTLGLNLNNLTLTGTSALSGVGNLLANTITSNGANCTLDGGTAGADTLIGGAGADTFIIGHSGEVIQAKSHTGKNTVKSAVNYTLTENLDNLTLTGKALIGTGNALDNVITDNGAVDTLVGGAGDDTYVVTNSKDVITELVDGGKDLVKANVSFTLGDNLENLTLSGTASISGVGNALANTIISNGANDTLDGGTAGADTLVGGVGADTFIVSHSGVTIQAQSHTGKNKVMSGIDYTLGENLDNLTLTGTKSLTATGNSLSNVITANNAGDTLISGSGVSTLIGGTGNDVLVGSSGGTANLQGGGGSDTYVIKNLNDKIVAGKGISTVQTSLDGYILGTGLNNLTLTGSDVLTGTGNVLANVLTDNGAADTLVGGAGNDTYVISNAQDVIKEDATGGIDTIQSSVSYTLGDNLENLTLTGTSPLNGVGNALANTITDNGAGGSTLDGGSAGADTLIGSSAGNDTFIISHTGETIKAFGTGNTVKSSISYALGANLQSLTLTGTANLTGTGNASDGVTLTANDGNDTLISGSGIETLIGGAGIDTYVINNAKDVIVDSSGKGIFQTGLSEYKMGKDMTNITFTGTGSSHITANDLDNITINASSGNDVIYAGAGVDTLIGGAGNDTYVISNANDLIKELTGGGIDTVQSSISYTLGDNLENLTLTGTSPLNGTGNALANTITDNNGGGDTLDGGSAGADTLIGSAAGNDTFIISHMGEAVNAFGTGNTVMSSISYTLGANLQSLTLTGTANLTGTGNSLNGVTLTANDGNDTLISGSGIETLVGGAGIDTYVINNAKDVIVDSSGKGIFQTGLSEYTMGANMKNLTLTASGSSHITANDLDDVKIKLGAGSAIIDTGAGIETITVGSGKAVINLNNLYDMVVDSKGNLITASTSQYTINKNYNNKQTLVCDPGGTITATGTDNTLTANDAGDTLIGSATGKNVFYISDMSDKVVAKAGATNSVIFTSGESIEVLKNNYIMPDNVQSVIMPENYARYGTTVTLNNTNAYAQGTALGSAFFTGSGNDTLVSVTNTPLLNPDHPDPEDPWHIRAYPNQYGASNDEFYFDIKGSPTWQKWTEEDMGQDVVKFNKYSDSQRTFLCSNASNTILPYIGIMETGNSTTGYNIVFDFSQITGKTSTITYEEDPTSRYSINQEIRINTHEVPYVGANNSYDGGSFLKNIDINTIIQMEIAYGAQHGAASIATMSAIESHADLMAQIAAVWRAPGTW